jgi:hypothetical protein
MQTIEAVRRVVGLRTEAQRMKERLEVRWRLRVRRASESRRPVEARSENNAA